MRYLGLLNIKSKNIHYKYVEELEDALNKVCLKVIKKVYMDDWMQEIADVLQGERMLDYDGIIVIRDNLFGPFYEFSTWLDGMKNKYDVWGLDYSTDEFGADLFPLVDTSFLVIEKNVVCSERFVEEIAQSSWLQYVLTDTKIKRGSVLTKEGEVFTKNRIDLCRYLPYETIVKKGIPFLSARCFTTENMLKYSIQHELRRVIDYLTEKQYNTASIWEYMIAELDVGDLKKILHLDYPLSTKVCVDPMVCGSGKIGVFVHAFYEELYDKCISYLAEIPQEIDIYISTCKDSIGVLKKKLMEKNVSVKQIVPAGNRGRDAGALLVGFAPFLKRYEYICFVHDKKTTGGLFPASEGMAFMDLIWDNLLPSTKYIRNIVGLFESNKYLGVLVPPLPVMGGYMASVVGKEWTICFDETMRLSQKINAPINISREKQPFALSTCFWCRSAALEDLFSYPWKLTDFPEEPLALDGTINHAIERIIPYLAQRKGFYSAVVYQIEYASIYLNNLIHIVDQIYGELNKTSLFDVSFPMDLHKALHGIEELAYFCKLHEEIYVYGAGAQAKLMKRKLDFIGIQPQAFLVSSIQGNGSSLEGYKVEVFAEVREKIVAQKAGIVIGMSEKFADEVVPTLEAIDYYKEQ